MDEFSLFVFFGGLVVIGIFLAIGKWYPGSGAEQVDWRPTRSPEVEAELEIDDVDQMIEAQNARRRASGRHEITEDDVRAQVAADERWRQELRRRARAASPPPGRIRLRRLLHLARTTDVARVLIVGCGCRGASLGAALAASGHAVRGTTRLPARVADLETAGIEGVVADPDRLGTLVSTLAGVTVVCWLMGSAEDSPDVHGPRLRSLVEHLVDTPVRGLVYEAAGTADAALLAKGASIVREASETWHMPVEIVDTDAAAHEAWLEAMKAAVGRLLSG